MHSGVMVVHIESSSSASIIVHNVTSCRCGIEVAFHYQQITERFVRYSIYSGCACGIGGGLGCFLT